MATRITSLDWQAVAGDPNELAAVLSLNTATDTLFIVDINGAPSNAPDGSAIQPNYIIVDNYANSGNVDLSYGPFVWVVGPFERKTFPVPQGLQKVTVLATVGIVGLAFVKDQYIPDSSNLFAIQQAATAVVSFPVHTYSVTTAQTSVDQNSTTIFAPVAAPINYTLIASGVSPLANGWLQFVRNEGTKAVSIKPAGADVINGVFTNAAPLILNPGDSGTLTFDGASWHFKGHTSFTSALQVFANATQLIAPHGLGFAPSISAIYMKCITAELGYSIGDIVSPFNPAYSVVTDATNLTLRTASNILAATSLFNKTTGVNTVFTAADWQWFIRADLWQ